MTPAEKYRGLLEQQQAELAARRHRAGEPDGLTIGLYRIYWRDGSTSLASVGMLHDGLHWFAPINWTAKDTTGIACTNWSYVHRVERVEVH